MTKIKNTGAYPFKIPVPQDFVPGTDSETEANNTVSFKFEDIVGLINSINGSEIISYIFAESPIGELDENGAGYFLSENNETDPENVTKLIVSKKIKTEIDLSDLFEFMSDNKDNFVLKLRNVSNPNNFIYFEIDNIIEDTYQFTFEVSVYNADYFEGILVDAKTYAFDFNLKAGSSPENYSKIVYVNAVSPTIATIFDIENPPVTNDNTLKNDVNNLYIGIDASTWVYITSPAGYITKTVSSILSNFYLSGTTTDAGYSKTAPIERTGTVGGAQGTAPNHFVTRGQLDLKEDLGNKQNSLSPDITNNKFPTVTAVIEGDDAVKAYADGLVVGLLNDRGSWNASSNLFPTTGGSGTSGAIRKGDLWIVSVDGVLAGKAVTVGDSFRALSNSPGQTASNWSVIETNIGYVPENITNKTGTIVGNEASTILYSHIAGLIAYFQQKLTDSMFGSFLFGLTAKTTPIDADGIVIFDTADSNKAKKTTFTNLKSFLKTYFDLQYAIPQITITTSVSITTATNDVSGNGQKGRNVVIANGANVINLTVNGGTDFVSSYVKDGTANITFVQGSGRTLTLVDGTNILDGIPGSTATISSIGTKDYLRISNAY